MRCFSDVFDGQPEGWGVCPKYCTPCFLFDTSLWWPLHLIERLKRLVATKLQEFQSFFLFAVGLTNIYAVLNVTIEYIWIHLSLIVVRQSRIIHGGPKNWNIWRRKNAVFTEYQNIYIKRWMRNKNKLDKFNWFFISKDGVI